MSANDRSSDVTATAPSMLVNLRLEFDPQVALRPEPFGALAYHYGNRKLVFLRHPDVVRVVQSLADHDSLSDTLRSCDIDPARWPSFERALAALTESEMLHERHEVAPG